ncbi:hypothetical protein K3N28_09625 [Glycomyces sp. TRM65418]|uniref:hypothetical protein n=1 Tax=Glycomyces sp. TRM65418 TaxID=2867006 RepID=UPI001CE623A2|nr:hypothetical protein [Glycomyces sp. TRM65418]MCC3763330.1 hypothetical protein [Glycomyces sp. TRM65418]QZD57327.1 hypothetical protein K3N28_09565 [Glycomyces sp. TRM65418]
MGDGGDGGMDADAIAHLPVEFGSETVLEAAGDPGDGVPVFSGAGGGDGGSTARERGEDVIDLAWIEPDTASGT